MTNDEIMKLEPVKVTTGDELIYAMIELDTINRVIFENQMKLKPLHDKIEALMEKLREEKKHGTIS